MSEPYVGEIRLFPYYRGAPRGWFVCDGSLLAISQYTTLYQLVGTTYGGNGASTFALPDLRGRVPVHQGSGLGLSSYTLGMSGGTENVTLTLLQLPQHTHAPVASTATATTADPTGMVLAAVGGNASGDRFYVPSGGSGTTAALPGATLGFTGNSLPHDNTAPTLVLQYCIAWQGNYPSRP